MGEDEGGGEVISPLTPALSLRRLCRNPPKNDSSSSAPITTQTPGGEGESHFLTM